MAQQLLLLVLLLTAAASTCITALAAPASPPLPEAFLAFAMWALLEPSREAQLGSRSPAMPGERNEHTRTRWNTRTRERGQVFTAGRRSLFGL